MSYNYSKRSLDQENIIFHDISPLKANFNELLLLLTDPCPSIINKYQYEQILIH